MIHRSSPNIPGALASVPALAGSMRMYADGTSGQISSSSLWVWRNQTDCKSTLP